MDFCPFSLLSFLTDTLNGRFNSTKKTQVLSEEEEKRLAFVDWNGNGKKDIQDNFIEYQIYQDCMKNNNATPGGNRDYYFVGYIFNISCCNG